MDEPTNPRGPNDTSWPEDSGSEQGFGATGVFRAVEPSDVKKEPATGPVTGAPGNRPADPFNPPSFIGSRPVVEPTVHKVVLGGGTENSPELLERMRMASQEKATIVERQPAAPASGGGGFTQLLRTLEVQMPSGVTDSKSATSPEPQPGAPDSGFTSLLRAMGTEESTAPPPAGGTKSGQPATVITSREPTKESPVPVPASSPTAGSGGFTELLRAAPDADPMMTYPLGARRPPVPTAPPPAENKPGSFTQLFSSLGTNEAAPSASPKSEKAAPSSGSAGSFTRMLSLDPQLASSPSEKVDSSGSSAGSFTRMLSLEPPQAPAEMPRFEENKPAADPRKYGVVPEPERPSSASSDPFSPQPFSSEPAPIAPQSGSVGITRLIQMLDEPSKAPPQPQREAPPMSPATSAGPGVWTQTFASLSTPGDPPAPVAKAPEWAPPPAPTYPDPPIARPAPIVTAPAVSGPPAAAGPSEFTRILDASRLREMAIKGGLGPAAEGAVPAPPQGASPPPRMPIPSYPVPVTPPPIGMQGGGAMAHPAAYPPPVPHAPGMYAPTPHIPQTPVMQVPTPHLPSAPPPAPAKPAPPAAGGLQQMVPILLVVVIVLLVVLIVTVFFLMKH